MHLHRERHGLHGYYSYALRGECVPRLEYKALEPANFSSSSSVIYLLAPCVSRASHFILYFVMIYGASA